MNLFYDKNHTCCFTGHRPHKLPFLEDEQGPRCVQLKQRLIEEILKKVMDDECGLFLCGMARGIDLICAQLVLDLRQIIGSPLALGCVVPYLEQAAGWEKEQQTHYKEILEQADEKILVSREYTSSCLFLRNRYLVDHSAHLIAVYGGGQGGTQYTLDYARKKQLCLAVINPSVFQGKIVVFSLYKAFFRIALSAGIIYNKRSEIHEYATDLRRDKSHGI